MAEIVPELFHQAKLCSMAHLIERQCRSVAHVRILSKQPALRKVSLPAHRAVCSPDFLKVPRYSQIASNCSLALPPKKSVRGVFPSSSAKRGIFVSGSI